jgi:hypothetical protein
MGMSGFVPRHVKRILHIYSALARAELVKTI